MQVAPLAVCPSPLGAQGALVCHQSLRHREPKCRHRCLVSAAHNDSEDSTGREATSSTQDAPQPRPSPGNGVETVQWGGTLPSGRRAVVGGLTGLTIALVGNLGGLTSYLLSLDGGRAAAALRADVLIPVLGYKRALNKQTGYEFQYPASWLVDQRLFRRAAEQAERRRPLDPPSLRSAQAQPERRVAEPTIAYGPPGSTGEENVSIIAAPIQPSFRLEDLGSAEQAGRRFLSTTVAPEGSGRVANLLAANARRDKNGVLYYYLEFTVQSPTLFRHNVSVYAARAGLLYTLNVQCPEQKWAEEEAMLRPIEESFNIL